MSFELCAPIFHNAAFQTGKIADVGSDHHDAMYVRDGRNLPDVKGKWATGLSPLGAHVGVPCGCRH